MKKLIMLLIVLAVTGCHYFMHEHQKYTFKDIKIIPNKGENNERK